MLAQLFDIQNYALNSAALLALVIGAVIGVLGIVCTVREGGSSVAAPFALMAAAGALWLICKGVALAAVHAEVASVWLHAAHLGIICLPLTFYWFTNKVVGPLAYSRIMLHTGVLLAIAFCAVSLGTNLFIESVTASAADARFFYGPVGKLFCIMFVGTMLSCGARYAWRLRRRNSHGSLRRRSLLLALASLLGALVSTEFLPALGVEWFSASSLVIACFFVLTAYVVGHYRLVDITPAFVGAQITNTMTDALLVLDRRGILQLANPVACTLLGKPAQELIGRQVDNALGSGLFYDQLNAMVEGHDVRDIELTYKPQSRPTKTLSVSASAIREHDSAPIAFMFILRDITSRKESQERIRQLAYFDELTGLPNRAEFHRRLNDYLSSRRRRREPLTMLFLDLDRFKRINDTLGHDAGDKLLQIVADRLRRCLRNQGLCRADLSTGDTFIARLGGDEFVICLHALDQRNVINKIARRILTVLAEPYDINGQEIFSSASIGISRYPDDGKDVTALLKLADTAMYEAKDAGRNNYQFYNTDLDSMNADRLRLENDIRRAMELGQFELHYQPLIDNRSQRVVGAEALLRWQHPTRGLVPPSLFVPIAEETGVIADIGDWVIDEACKTARQWHRRGHEHMRIAVNVSERQFRRHNLPNVVSAALTRNDLPAECLDIELTEGIIMRDVDATINNLTALKRMGVSISVDDFGTGYSSLAYLKRLPIDVLKVDGTFTRGVAINKDDAAITRAIIAMAKSLRLNVIAECVETPDQVDFLRELDCHMMQGYLFGRPMPADQFDEFLSTGTGCHRFDDNVVTLRPA